MRWRRGVGVLFGRAVDSFRRLIKILATRSLPRQTFSRALRLARGFHKVKYLLKCLRETWDGL